MCIGKCSKCSAHHDAAILTSSEKCSIASVARTVRNTRRPYLLPSKCSVASVASIVRTTTRPSFLAGHSVPVLVLNWLGLGLGLGLGLAFWLGLGLGLDLGPKVLLSCAQQTKAGAQGPRRCGLRAAGCAAGWGRWAVGGGRWAAGGGWWMVGGGRWAVDCGGGASGGSAAEGRGVCRGPRVGTGCGVTRGTAWARAHWPPGHQA